MKDASYFEKYIATVPNFPKEGIFFKDVAPTLEDPDAFKNCIDAMAELIQGYDFDKIVCADARGFLFGAPLAYKMGKGLVIARKPGKLPRPGVKASYSLEYGTNSLEISEGAIKPGEKYAVLDDVLATGGTCGAMMKMLMEKGAKPVVGIFYIGLPDVGGKERMQEIAPIDVLSVVQFPGA